MKITKAIVFVSSLGLLFCFGNAFAKAPKAAAGCVSCHGKNGKSLNPKMFPNLAGLKKSDLKKKMIAYKKGTIKNPLMNSVMKPLSEKDINALAEYYSKLKK